ncbi:MAG: DUF1844 domain-containing protein [Verrucomicrobia bacterium]|nr:DUF1844 domain-containing protein [Verrucomicrobiota bacterium]
MPEIQKTTALGEMTQRFIEFVMMQAQQAAMFLGRIPNPQTGKPEVNLEIARMFIDQLEMIHEKTRGNLTGEESEILTRVLSDLQLTFVQAAGGAGAPSAPLVPDAVEESAPADSPAPVPAAAPEHPSVPAPEAESRKKFTKSYGN